MNQPLIEGESIPAVKSLRSKFEQLALDIPNSPKPMNTNLYLSPRGPMSPRPRASSGSQAESTLVQHLRSSSSSSDLQTKSKRPPPPPPPRGTRQASPSPLSSPLLRPVPAPPIPATSFGLLVDTGADANMAQSFSPGVAALRSKLLDTASIKPLSPRQTNSQTNQALGLDPFAIRSNESMHSRSSSSKSTSENSLFSADGRNDSDTDLSPTCSQTTPTRPILKLNEETSQGEVAVIKPPPPRPPPRHRATIHPPGSKQEIQTAPPLPERRSTASPQAPAPAPPLPPRTAIIPPNDEAAVPEKKTGRLAPPPKRMIGLGDKLPEMRRPPSPDESSSDEEEVVDVRDQLPDRTQTSRRAPICDSFADPKVVIPATERHTAICGHYAVVAGTHHLRVYDTHSPTPAHPLYTLDIKDMGFHKDSKLSCVGLRCASPQSDKKYIWVGTTTGNLCEVELSSRKLTGLKLSAHAGAVTEIFKSGTSMITMDETGKTLIFNMSGSDEKLGQSTQPRILRTNEKHDFACIVRGKLWVTSRSDFNISTAGGRVPIIRIYDIFHPGSPSRNVIPCDRVGAITGLTVVQSMPGFAYMSHEEGYISVWSLDTDDGTPSCIETTRIQISDVTTIAGVCDKLWIGSRNGSISVADIKSKPWKVTNQWDAFKNLPVLEFLVDWESTEKSGSKLIVASVGRSGEMKFWDGLLGADWIDRKLLQRQAEYSTFRDIKVLVVSWNADAAKPQDLGGDSANLSFLSDVLSSEDSPDIISFGFQEVIDLESRKMAAKSVIMQGKKKIDDGALSDHVTGAYKRWYECLIPAVRLAMPPETPYHVIHTESMVGLFTCIFVKSKERVLLKDIATKTVKRGMGGRYGNKGGILARFVIEDSSICLINCHLAAGQTAIRQRNADIASFLESKDVFPESDEPHAYVDGGNGEMVLDHDIVIINGDMNYRIDQRRETAIASIHANEYENLLSHDQLLKEMKFNKGFRLRAFCEGPLHFAPTYKYDRRSNVYDSSEKSRTPAWCDRILWHTRVKERVEQTHYRRYEANVSDHRPISAGFKVKVKSVRYEVREKLKSEVKLQWADEQLRLLADAKAFYVRQLFLH